MIIIFYSAIEKDESLLKMLGTSNQSLKSSNKYGMVKYYLSFSVDNKEEGQEIDPKAAVQNFQNLPNRYYFDENGHHPSKTTYSEIGVRCSFRNQKTPVLSYQLYNQ